MNSPEEMVWNHAVDNEDYELARQIEIERVPATGDEQDISNAAKEQRAILGAAAYWGVDYGSLPRHEP